MTVEMNGNWAVVARDRMLLDDLEPLIEARRRIGSVQVVGSLAEALGAADSILMAGGEAPQSAIVSTKAGRRVPVGWIGADRDGVRVFARAAAELAPRDAQGLAPGPAVLLGQWDDGALRLADEVESACETPLLRWTAERLVRREMLDALRCGPGVAMYLGHALSGGWVGYGGITASAFTARRMQPLGAILTIASDAAQCNRSRPSFCDELVLRGVCAAALGATGKSQRETNRVLARCIARGLTRSATLGGLLLQVPDEALRGYRIAGDPGAALIGATHALEIASEVYAPSSGRLIEPVAGARNHWSADRSAAQR
jgi:hypothetical protein